MVSRVQKWLKKQSLVFKLSLGILACFFLTIIVLLGIVTRQSETVIKEQILELTSSTTAASIDDIGIVVRETEHLAKNLKNILNKIKPHNKESIEVALKSALESMYDSGLDVSHVAVFSYPPYKNSAGTLYSAFAKNGQFFFKNERIKNHRQLFPISEDQAKEEKIVWTEPYDCPETPSHNLVISCILPFKFLGDSKISGLVSISIELDVISQYINAVPIRNEGKLILISQGGLYLIHPDPEVHQKATIDDLAKKLNSPQLYLVEKRVLSGEAGYIEIPYSSIYQEPTLFFCAPVPNLKWGVCFAYPQDTLYKPIYDLQIMIILSGIAGMLIMGFLINKISGLSTMPLLRLTKIARQYGVGNFSDKVAENYSEDEIGTLAKAFHNMRINLVAYIEKEKKVASEMQRSENELAIARQIQSSALPYDFPEHHAFQIHALMLPARQIGGDFYDFFFLNNNKIALVIADVAGKGITAALYMMRAKEIIKHMTQRTNSPKETFEVVNDILAEGNSSCMFMSAFYAVIDLETGEMEYVNAGHLPPFIIEDSKCRKITPEQNFILGARQGVSFQSEKIQLSKNSRLFLYTDGVTEAENTKSELYGEKRLEKVLQKDFVLPSDMINAVITDIQEFARDTTQSDDITMLSFLYQGLNSNTLRTTANNIKLKTVLNFIEQNMTYNQVPDPIRFKVMMMAEEIFSNISQYAYTTEGKVKIETSMEDDIFSLIFTDEGTPYNPLEYELPDVTLPLEQRPTGGLGIFIVRNMADFMDYNYQDGMNILKIGMRIKEA